MEGKRKPPGRPKGTPNNLTKSVKEAFEAAFNWMQNQPGVGLREWGKDNPTDFYKIAARLIPTDVNATITTHESAIDLLNAGAKRKAPIVPGLPDLRGSLPKDQDQDRLH